MNSTLNHLDDTQLLKILFHSPLATGVYTTENIIIHFANDAMIEFWGKDTSVIGKPMIEAIPELEGQPFVDILKNVWRTGISYQAMNTPAELSVNNRTSKFYFDFVYKALKNDAGKVYAILHTAVDVTERNLDQQKVKESRLALTHEQAMNDELASSNEELFATIEELHATQEELSTLNNELEDRVSDRTKVSAASEARIRFILNDAPVAITILTGREMIVEAANKKILEVWGKTGEVIGKPLQVVLPELVGQDFLQLLDEVYTPGKPYYGNEVKALLEKNGVLEEVYSNFIFQTIRNINGIISGVIVTANIVTEQVLARKLLQNSEKEQQAINEVLSATIEELATANEDQIIINEELSHTQDKLQEMISNLAHSEKRLRFMLNAMPQQVWTSDPQGALDYVNQVVCNDFGYTTDEIVGHGWKKFIHPDDLDRCLKKWNLALETGLEYLIEFRLLFRDGTYRWHLSRALPFIEEGQVRLWVGTNTNIEIQKENEMKKDEFLSIASHELKTPLTSIKAFNQLLLRVKDPVLMEGFAKKSSEHIIRLERLISDLLDVTKINAGKLQYNMEPFNFGKMLSNSVQVLRHTSTDHEIILQSIADIDYTGDQFRLELVINNFISNAVKYSPEGEKVIVNSKIEMDYIVVSVQDFGIGIPEENLDKLFDRYYRVDNTAMRFEGLGLGLFISSEILKRHHGSFWIESLPGKGSTFYFRLPLFPDIKNEH
jgi:two-component system CheB/CheR fusion protein